MSSHTPSNDDYIMVGMAQAENNPQDNSASRNIDPLSLEERRLKLEERRVVAEERRAGAEERRAKAHEDRTAVEASRLTLVERQVKIDESRIKLEEDRLNLEEARHKLELYIRAGKMVCAFHRSAMSRAKMAVEDPLSGEDVEKGVYRLAEDYLDAMIDDLGNKDDHKDEDK